MRQIKNGEFFKFKEKSSRDYRMRIFNITPITRAAKRVTEYTVSGRSGTLFFDEDAYENQLKVVEGTLPNNSPIDEVLEWLTGRGRVIFGNEPDKYYEGFVRGEIALNERMPDFRIFQVQFECQPFKYSVNEINDFISLTAQLSTFIGKGTRYAKPTITVYGNGTITLRINGELITLTNVSGSITINSEIMEAYRGNIKLSNTMTGEYPVLLANKQVNTIAFTGNVTKIEVVPSWRWL